MTSALDTGAIARVDQLSREFLEARPFRNVVIEPFLDPGFCADLITQFPPFDRDKALNELGEVGRQGGIFEFLRGSARPTSDSTA